MVTVIAFFPEIIFYTGIFTYKVLHNRIDHYIVVVWSIVCILVCIQMKIWIPFIHCTAVLKTIICFSAMSKLVY